MNPKNKFWWFVALSVGVVAAIAVSVIVLFWHELSLQEKEFLVDIFRKHFAYVFIVAVVILAGIGFGMDGIFHTYIIPVSKLAEETTIIATANPAHRIRLEGSKDIQQLVQSINQGADHFEALRKHIQEKVRNARAESENEKNILAAFMAELPEGVLICNNEGRILFYNKMTKKFLVGDKNAFAEDQKTDDIRERDEERYIGLGRAVFSVIDRNLIIHALDEIAEKLERNEENATSFFVLVGIQNKILRVETVPILDPEKRFTGYILILSDITQRIESDSYIESLIRNFTTGVRASSAVIRSTIEAVLDYPDMQKDKLRQFMGIIHKEALSMSELINRTDTGEVARMKTEWPLVQMPDRDLVEAFQKKAREKLDIEVRVSYPETVNWIRVDSYSIVLSMLFVLDQLIKIDQNRQFTFRCGREVRFVNFDLIWDGEPVKTDLIRQWSDARLKIDGETIPLTLKEVIGHHEGEILSYKCIGTASESYFRLILPAVEYQEPKPIRNIMILPESRPEFYDFDLFHQAGQTPELDDCLLTELSYTVFDTETTGLDPSGGDEIISIGAVRIVNNHLLREELFDQLIDPKRPVPDESVKVHGIKPEMLVGQPTIDKVLPLFHKFCEETILVAHNAAFDMRMLEMKESSTGIKFINPVLDTLLLSAVVHPAHDRHNMEAISRRLGIRILGRHTALGDAVSTAELFLKLIPLLAQRGIYTLKEARIASQKTYYARLKY